MTMRFHIYLPENENALMDERIFFFPFIEIIHATVMMKFSPFLSSHMMNHTRHAQRRADMGKANKGILANIFKEDERNSRVRKVSQHEEMIYICVYTMLPRRRVFSCSTNLYISQRNELNGRSKKELCVFVHPYEKLFLVNSSEFPQTFCVSPYSWYSWFTVEFDRVEK